MTETFQVRIKEGFGDRNSYGYFTGEIYEVENYAAVAYRVVNPPDKKEWIIYHAHCKKVN